LTYYIPIKALNFLLTEKYGENRIQQCTALHIFPMYGYISAFHFVVGIHS